MCSRPQFTNLAYMGGTVACGPMTIIFGSINIKFGVKRTFHVLKTPVYRFDLYGRYQILFTDIADISIPTSVRVIEAYVQIFQSVALCVRTQSCLPQTDGQTDIAQISQNFALIKYLQGTQGRRSVFLGVTNVLTKLIYPL